MTMQQRREPAAAAFGSLPPATTSITVERALELAGVDETELALAYETTFKEARSIEELVTLVATTRRRGLDTLSKHIYYEKFGGESGQPSLHISIDGLRAIAANTNRFAGRLEPRFTGVAGEVTEGGRKRTAPEKCVVSVYALVQGHKALYEGTAWWDEAYPGDGPRGRMWRLRPRGMLAIAAERQALRSAFPAQTSGLADVDDVESVVRTRAENAAAYTRIYGSDDDDDRVVDLATGEVIDDMVRNEADPLWQKWLAVLALAQDRGLNPEALTLPIDRGDLKAYGDQVLLDIKERKKMLAKADQACEEAAAAR